MNRTRIEGPARIGEHEEPAVQPERKPQRDTLAEIRHSDESARLFAQNALPSAVRSDATSSGPTPNDDVLYLGINTGSASDSYGPQNDYEWKGLTTFAHAERVATSTSSMFLGFDLSKAEDIDKFSKTLGVSEDQAKTVAAAIRSATVESRDELAGIATVLARGERGEKVPSRWILSGHHGDVITDARSSNQIDVSDVRAIAKALPKGAAFVEDIMISGCYSGSKELAEAWKPAFPNLRSVWGYGKNGEHNEGDRSPTGAWAVRHMQDWEHATRGRATPTANVQRSDALAAGNISYWDGAYHPAISHK